MKKTMLLLSLIALMVMFSSFAMAEDKMAKCVQLPVTCNSNSDCTCSGCCSNWHVCQPTCHSNPNPEFVLNQKSDLEMVVANSDSCSNWLLQTIVQE